MSYQIGTAIHDVTGPAAETGMMGMSNFEQKTAGILQRLYARTFVIEEGGNRVAIVVADLWSSTLAVKEAVVQRLAGVLKGQTGDPLFTRDNILIHGNHTHSGPGGYSHYPIYNLSILGFDRQNFNCIVDGIVESIKDAYRNLAPGEIFINQGELLDCGKNRSIEAYNNNPADERNGRPSTDREMLLLKFTGQDGTPLGILNWYPIHTTSLGEKNLLISGDNKGYAEYLFEQKMRSLNGSFIAAFANANCGDVSGNVDTGVPDGIHDIERMEALGQKQYDRAWTLFQSANQKLEGPVNYVHAHVDMSDVLIGDDKRTFPAAIGVSMPAGSTQDSTNHFANLGIREGLTTDDPKARQLAEVVSDWLTPLLDVILPGVDFPSEDDWPVLQTANGTRIPFEAGHGKKPVAMPQGLAKPYPLTPHILPLQIIRLGHIALVAVPAEITTMAGRRLRRTVEEALVPEAGPPPEAVITSTANAYAGYITTKEEYDMQYYEGASTLFGPYTLLAYQQEFGRLAAALRGEGASRVQVDPGPMPPDLSDRQRTLQTGVVLDSVPLFHRFGEVLNKAGVQAIKGDEIVVKFWAGHPKNDLRPDGTFLEIQKRIGDGFKTIATDNDESTRFQWRRADSGRERTGLSLHIPGTKFSALSVATVTWKIPLEEQSGGAEYRIVHMGDTSHSGEYVGQSPSFELRDQVDAKQIHIRNASPEKVTIQIYPSDAGAGARYYKKAVLWDEDRYLFDFDPSIAPWGEKARIKFDWGREEQWLTVTGGMLVKIQGKNDISLV